MIDHDSHGKPWQYDGKSWQMLRTNDGGAVHDGMSTCLIDHGEFLHGRKLGEPLRNELFDGA